MARFGPYIAPPVLLVQEKKTFSYTKSLLLIRTDHLFSWLNGILHMYVLIKAVPR
jgi:hypothetical protein